MPLDPRILIVGTELAPELIAWFKAQFQARNPGLPLITDDEALAGLAVALSSSLATDAKWLADHPAPAKPPTGSS